MANTKKYVSLDKLSIYDEKIKGVISTGDANALQSAKDYADSLAVNYDAAGKAASALADAKAYADGKDAAIQAAQKAADDAAAAAAVADGKAVAAQGEVDALETYVGTFTHATAKSVVEYVDAKTAGIATDAALGELQATVTQLGKDIDAVEADYLKAADKTELEGAIEDVQGAVDAEAERATGVEEGLAARIKAVEDDYLTSTDKTELANAISAEAERADGIEKGLDTRIKAVEDDYLKAADKEALQNQINTIMNNPDAEGAINSINEFTQYVTEHGTIAEGFRSDIDQNKEDIAANAKAITDHEALAAQTYATKSELAAEKSALQSEIDADVKVVADDLAELEGVVTGLGNTKADVTALNEAVEALEGADTELGNRLTTLENKFTGEGSVEDQIADAKQEAIDAAALDATSKANTAEGNAKSYTDAEIDKVEATVATLTETVGTKAAQADLTALAGRVETAEGEIDTLQSEMDAVEALAAAADAAAKANASAIALKADTTALNAVSDRVTTLETWHNNFTECSEAEILELFNA